MFEQFTLNEGKAESWLEELVNKMFPDHTLTFDNPTAGEYRLDSERTSTGTEKILFAEVYLAPDEYEKVDAEINGDYESYVKKVESFGDGKYPVEVSTIDGEAVVITITY